MPSFVSKRGEWYPAKEKIGLTNMSDKPIEYNGQTIQPGEPFVYDGPDREAVKELALQGLANLGKDFKTDPDFLQGVRNQGFNSVDEYLKFIGYDEKNDEEEFKKRSETFKAHEIKERAEAIRVIAGGQAKTKEESIIGGFGDERMTPAKK